MLNLINILSEGTQNAVNDGGLVEMEVGSPGWRNPWQAGNSGAGSAILSATPAPLSSYTVKAAGSTHRLFSRIMLDQLGAL